MINPYAAAIALAAVVGGGVYYFTRRESAGVVVGEPIFANPPPSKEDFDGLSDKVEALVKALEQSTTATPEQVSNAAQEAKKKGLTYTAIRLEENALWRSKKMKEGAAKGPLKHVLVADDTGAGLSKKYTGTATRWLELEGMPTTAGTLKKMWMPPKYDESGATKGFYYFSPWVIGMTIYLPKSWANGQKQTAVAPSADWAKL